MNFRCLNISNYTPKLLSYIVGSKMSSSSLEAKSKELSEEFKKLDLTSSTEKKIQVHESSNKPDDLWAKVSKKYTYTKLTNPMPLNEPIKPDKIRIVCISDTHSRTNSMRYPMHDIEADILIHAGDFTMHCSQKEIIEFDRFLESLTKIKNKIVIAGNHEFGFDSNIASPLDVNDPVKLLKNCTYLQDSGIELFGLKIYGSPWQPRHGSNAFQTKRGKNLLYHWNMIPNDTDILITHGPPMGYGDQVRNDDHVGCVELFYTVQERVKPKFHIFGHIHESYGVYQGDHTTFVNASICQPGYRPVNPPILFDIDKPLASD